MPEQGAPAGAGRAPVRPAYPAYVLAMLVLIYTSNFIDRTLVGVLAQPIREDLGLSDAQLGVLGGLSFAILYSTLGIPVARLAEKRSRVGVISLALAIWSGMTALCGAATGFLHLMLARIGVGIGEAGCIPPANSLLADYFPPERRATAAGIFSLGIPFGAVAGALLGSWIAQTHGWRAAFFLLGAPGLLLALVFRLTVKEPPRGVYDPPGAAEAPPLGAVVRTLARKRAFLHMAFGAALSSFAGYGISTFAIPFLLRGFPLTQLEAGLAFALFGGISAAVGVGCGGALVDWAGRRDRRLHVLIPAAGFLLAAPLYMAAFLQSSLPALAALVVAPAILQYLYLGPIFALTQNMVGARSRATAAAILTLVINLIGLGLGPTLIGAASDVYAAMAFAGDYLAACTGDAAAGEACRIASFIGLQRALVTAAAVYLWAGLHFVLAARTLRADLEI